MEKFLIIGILASLVVYILILFNELIKLNNSAKEAFSTMDVYLKKRWDLIPNLVEVVRAYAKHEEDTFTEIASLRSGTYDKMSENEKLKTNEQLEEDVSKLMVIVENYPELKANQNFLELSKELLRVEEDIANSRKFYNATVRDFNNKVEMFPSNLVAKIMDYKIKEYFKITEVEQQNVKINSED